MLVAGVAILAYVTVLNEHLVLGPVAWIAVLGYAALACGAAARIFLVDASHPPAPQRVERTRQLGMFIEVIIAGTGSLFLLAPAAYLALTTSDEVWFGRVEPASGFSVIGFVFTFFFGLLGFFMALWRPQFVLDPAVRKIVRYPFGRSVPLGKKETPYSELAVSSEGYFRTNTGVRLGDMIRGRVRNYTFELELVDGNLPADVVQSRAMAWATALGATYQTPEQAADAELRR
jgi:hypothetical protein